MSNYDKTNTQHTGHLPARSQKILKFKGFMLPLQSNAEQLVVFTKAKAKVTVKLKAND